MTRGSGGHQIPERLPAIRLVSSIGGAFLLMVSVASVWLAHHRWQAHLDADAEVSGLPAAAAILELARTTAVHRGMTAGLLAGEGEFRDRRWTAQAEVQQRLVTVIVLSGIGETPQIRALREGLAVEVPALLRSTDLGELAASDSFHRHTALIERELELLDEIAYTSGLALDGEPVTHELYVASMQRLPRVAELLGQVRGRRAAGRYEPDDRAWAANTLAICLHMLGLSQEIPAAPPGERVRAELDRLVRIVQEHRAVTSALLDFEAFTRASEATLELAGRTRDVLEARLRARAHAARRAAALIALGGMILLAISGWLVAFSVRLVRRALASRDQARDLADHTTAFLATMLEAAPEGVVIVDTAGKIELVSAQVKLAFGYARADLLGQPVSLLFTPPVLPRVRDTAPNAERLTGEVLAVTCRRRNGTTFPAEITASPVQLGSAEHVIFVVRDVSARHAMEYQLQQSQRMEAIGQLTGGLAHDFNNLLGVIVGNLDLLERHVRHDERAAARVATAQRAAMRGSDLTRRLLAFARCQHLDPQPTAVNRVIAELLEILPRTLGPEIEITTALAPDLPTATVDAQALESALLNLALNARDAMRGGGKIAITTRVARLGPDDGPVRAGTVIAGDYVRITVADTGHGMSPATIARVFEPFFTTKPRGKGTGLGLAMVYGFVTQSRGHIHIDSEVDVGTTFTIDLPVAADAAVAPTVAPPAPRPVAAKNTSPATVLVVDDEPDLREIATTYCQELGLRVLQASDGISALELAVQQPRLDLLLTDILMPGGLSGVALAACLRPQHPELRVVYCSGFPASELAERSELHVDAPLILKPYLKHAFVQIITEALARSSATGGVGSPPEPGVEHEHARATAPADR